jgi:hypothetical protein
MTVGNLVRITRAGIGVPVGTIALIIEDHTAAGTDVPFFVVWPAGEVGKRGSRRYLSRDLEVIK